jgi:hypothetical protein
MVSPQISLTAKRPSTGLSDVTPPLHFDDGRPQFGAQQRKR